MIYDVRLAAEGSRPVGFYGTAGGIVPSPDQVADRIRAELRPAADRDGPGVRAPDDRCD
jgi:hypothetical protein